MDYINTMPEFESIQDAENWAAAQGVKLTANDRAKIAEAQRAEQKRLAALGDGGSFTDRFNASYAKFLDAMLHLQDLVQAFGRTLIVGFGMTAILIIALIVEQERLVAGFQMFEAREHIAHYAAWFLVLLNAALEFVVFFEDDRRGWNDKNQQVWSLRIFARNMAYRLGIGKTWQARELPPSHWARQLLRLITIVVLTLALFGSMKEEMLKHDSNYLKTLHIILTESTLYEIATWLGGFLFALAAVRGAQGTARYLAYRTAEVIEDLHAQEYGGESADLEAPGVAYIMAKVAKQQERDAAKRAQQEEARAVVPLGQNDKGR